MQFVLADNEVYRHPVCLNANCVSLIGIITVRLLIIHYLVYKVCLCRLSAHFLCNNYNVICSFSVPLRHNLRQVGYLHCHSNCDLAAHNGTLGSLTHVEHVCSIRLPSMTYYRISTRKTCCIDRLHYITIKNNLGIWKIKMTDVWTGRSAWSISFQVAFFTLKRESCSMADRRFREIYLQTEVYIQISEQFSEPIGITQYKHFQCIKSFSSLHVFLYAERVAVLNHKS
jgi:hypothetical protein